MNHIDFAEEVLLPAGDSDLCGRTDGAEVDVSGDAGSLPKVQPIREKGASDPFQVHRARMFAIAYRMLGSRADAEDLLQDVYLRWHHAANDDIRSPVAFLVAITTRLCLDRLRESKQQRGQYTGPKLLEPAVENHTPSPEAQIEFTEEVSAAFLAVLERLGPAERAAFLLHDLFDYEYCEVAHFLGKTQATCRQVIHRARRRLRESRGRFAVSAESRARLLRRFLVAIGTGDRQVVAALLAEDVEYEAAGLQ